MEAKESEFYFVCKNMLVLNSVLKSRKRWTVNNAPIGMRRTLRLKQHMNTNRVDHTVYHLQCKTQFILPRGTEWVEKYFNYFAFRQ